LATTTSPMTAEELLALPEDGIDRELIDGELREYPMTTRGRPHCLVMTNLARVLSNWLILQPQPRGTLYTGDIRIRIRRKPDTFVGADLALVSAELETASSKDVLFIDGLPTLTVEITSPSDTAESMAEKVVSYLKAGVPLVWEVNPYYEAVTVHRPGLPPELFNVTQDLTAEPHLPGFRVSVAEIFAT
jgi:Uma2 family endonuclease